MASLLSRLEMYHFGVKVSIIEPGFFNTGITHAASVEKVFLKYWERLPDETKASYGDKYWKDCECIPRAHLAPQCCAAPGPHGPPGHEVSTCPLPLPPDLANMNRANRSCNPNLSMVTNCMEHALTSRYPRCRYAVGWDARLFVIPLSYMPSAIFDAFFTHLYPKPAQRG